MSDPTTAVTRATVQRLLEVLVAPRPELFEGLREVYAPDAVFVDRSEPTGRIEGVDRVLAHLRLAYGQYEATAIEIRQVLAQGPDATVLWRMVFRQAGVSGARAIEGAAHLRVIAGRVVLHREYYDHQASHHEVPGSELPEPPGSSVSGLPRRDPPGGLLGAPRPGPPPGPPGSRPGLPPGPPAPRPEPAGVPGLPRCLGGARGSRAAPVAWPPRCAGCLDREACAGPGGLAPGLLRPRHTTDPLADVLAALGALGPVDAAVARGLASLHAMLPGESRASATLELSCKLSGDAIVQWPRVTCYEPRGGAGRAATLATLATLAPAGEPRERLARALAGLARDVTIALGLAPGEGGLVVRAYATPAPGPAGVRGLREFLGQLGSFAGLDGPLERPVASVGVALAPGGERVRIYERVAGAEVSRDPAADPDGSVAWDLSAERPPEPTARYVHYLRRHLSWEQVARRGQVGPALSERLEQALFLGRARAFFTAVGVSAGSRTLYFQVGPGVREGARQ